MLPDNTKIMSFLNQQIAQTDNLIDSYTLEIDGRPKPKRDLFATLQNYIEEFVDNKSENRWVVITGLRGTGKTTLLAQLYATNKNKEIYQLFLTVDQITNILNLKLYDTLNTYSTLINQAFENLDKPLLLFLDEVQAESQWGIVLKNLYDRSRRTFIIATGSAALTLNSNADIARRAIFEKLYPLHFNEYLRIKNLYSNQATIEAHWQNIFFHSTNSTEFYQELKAIQQKLQNNLLGVSRTEITNFLCYGSLPFMLKNKNEMVIYAQVNKIIERIIDSDINDLAKFSAEIIGKIPHLLYMLADTDIKSVTKFSSDLNISRPTVVAILDALEKSEILQRLYPHGSHTSQVNKPLKYLFFASAFRAMYFNLKSSVKANSDYLGKLLEDVVGMYLHRYLNAQLDTAINYDSAQNGADFIISLGKEKIIIEVGLGTKNIGQILTTAKKITAKYSVIISANDLALIPEHNIIQIPIELFLQL
jgi:uncharacterized protein